MKKISRQNVILYSAIFSFFAFFVLFMAVDPWFGIGILISMAVIGKTIENKTIEEWNNGICSKHNEPWEFSSYGDLSDGDTSFHFKSRDLHISFGRTIMYKVMKSYKGKIKIKGL